MNYIGACVIAFSLLLGWCIALVTAAIFGWSVLRVTQVVRNRRMALVLIVPFIAAFLNIFGKRTNFFYFVLLLWLAPAILAGHRLVLPLPGSTAHLYGEFLFAFVFSVYTLVYLPRQYGAPISERLQELDTVVAANILYVRMMALMLVGVIIVKYRGPYCSIVVALDLVFAVVLTRLVLGAAAHRRHSQAPEVEVSADPPSGAALFAHLSDLHITCQKNGLPTGGGRSGLADLERLAAAAENGRFWIPFLFISGDIVDRGDADEWQRVMVPLRKLRERNIRVVLAPGNHDVLQSYSPGALLWAAIRPKVAVPVVEGKQLRRFLDAALELEPAMATCDGSPLAQYLERFDAPWISLKSAWDDLRAQAIAAIGATADTRHSTALRRYRRALPADAAAAVAKFTQVARLSYPNMPEDFWREQVFVIGPHVIEEFLTGDPWQQHWYAPYPLRCAFTQGNYRTEVLILNSTPPAPLLGQSSLGKCSDEQIDRLDALLAASQARTIIVMHHHSFARWKGKAYTFQRWGTLADDHQEAQRLFDLMRKHSSPARNLFVLMGHTHERSQPAFVSAQDDAAHGFWYLESAAFGELQGRDIVFGARQQDGSVRGALAHLPL